MPLLHASAEVFLNERWSLSGEVDGMSYDDTEYLNAGMYVNWYTTPLWRLSLGGRIITGKIDEPEMYNDVEISDLSFQITRMF